MNMIYNSPSYCVVEFELEGDPLNVHGGFEIMDKTARRETFIGGALADRFREDVAELVHSDLTYEEIDDYLSGFDNIMQHPLALH
ncbi:MAG: DUF3567 domain-containing protein [Burkholderiaceae bacterium]